MHVLRLVRALGRAAVVIIVFAVTFVLWKHSPAWFGWLSLAAFVVTMAYGFARVLQHRAIRIVVTNRRVLLRAGVLRRTAVDLELTELERAQARQTLLERLVRLGHLELTTASGASHTVRDIAGARGLCEVIIAARGRALEASSRKAAADPSGERGRAEHLHALHERGVLTDSELQQYLGHESGNAATGEGA